MIMDKFCTNCGNVSDETILICDKCNEKALKIYEIKAYEEFRDLILDAPILTSDVQIIKNFIFELKDKIIKEIKRLNYGEK